MMIDEICAPPAWRCVDFISDLHLQASDTENFSALTHHLAHSPADAIFILGDLFELWVGDDAMIGVTPQAEDHVGQPEATANNGRQKQTFEDRCAQALRRSAEHRKLFFLPGNRDFLIGEHFAQACDMQVLQDPSVFQFGDERYLLSHGDSLCLADEPYQKFRSMVRDPDWQAIFLQKPAQDRLQLARGMRTTSLARKNDQQLVGQAWIDIDQPTAIQWMNAAHATHFIHGHTHEGRDHVITSKQGQGTRHVLPDWHAGGTPAAGYVLRLNVDASSKVTAHQIPLV
jgi:UDP-2,3-diacylglucosamine hydrolase